MSRTTLLMIAATCWLATTTIASAQDEEPIEGDGTEYVDKNGDGIDDGAAVRHQRRHHRAHARGVRKGQKQALMAGLTDGQKAEIKTAVTALRESGADRETVHTKVGELLVGFGVTLPDNWGEPLAHDARGHRRQPTVFGELTDEQKIEVRSTIDALKEVGADQEAIHAAVGTLIEGFGFTLPENWDAPRPMGDRGGSLLTEEQRTEIHSLRTTLKEQGADRQAIHEAVKAKFEEMGVDPPPPPRRRRRHLDDTPQGGADR